MMHGQKNIKLLYMFWHCK